MCEEGVGWKGSKHPGGAGSIFGSPTDNNRMEGKKEKRAKRKEK